MEKCKYKYWILNMQNPISSCEMREIDVLLRVSSFRGGDAVALMPLSIYMCMYLCAHPGRKDREGQSQL